MQTIHTDIVKSTLTFVHDLLFAFGNRAVPQNYYTVFTLDSGDRFVCKCDYGDRDLPDELQPNIEGYATAIFGQLESRKVVGFALLAPLYNERRRVYEYWCLASDNQMIAESRRFTPYMNEDGVFDYMEIRADPYKDVEELEPMVLASTSVWRAAVNSGNAVLEVDGQSIAGVR